MARPKVLMACTNYWEHPLKVGSYHLARCFAQMGWDVAYISDPISPLHFLKLRCHHLQARRRSYHARGGTEGSIWHYVPATLVPPKNLPGLQWTGLRRHWQRFTFPNILESVRQRGFASVDLLYFDNARQPFWLKKIDAKKSVYRIADYTPGFPGISRFVQDDERKLARRVDQVFCVSKMTESYAQSFGVQHVSLLPNGVCFDLFAQNRDPKPAEYASLTGPIAVYAGALEKWFDQQRVRVLAQRMPEIQFVLIGPHSPAVRRFFSETSNVTLLGPIAHSQLPAYLRWADVGLIPFDVQGHQDLIEGVHPLKLYEYFASGLPVVASHWQGLASLKTPAYLYHTLDEFEQAIRQALSQSANVNELIECAKPHDWSYRLSQLLKAI